MSPQLRARRAHLRGEVRIAVERGFDESRHAGKPPMLELIAIKRPTSGHRGEPTVSCVLERPIAFLRRETGISAQQQRNVWPMVATRHQLDTREPRLGKLLIRDHILAAERAEEAEIERAASEGSFIPRRANADPRAVLGIQFVGTASTAVRSAPAAA
jgi:hypothetical protein